MSLKKNRREFNMYLHCLIFTHIGLFVTSAKRSEGYFGVPADDSFFNEFTQATSGLEYDRLMRSNIADPETDDSEMSVAEKTMNGGGLGFFNSRAPVDFQNYSAQLNKQKVEKRYKGPRLENGKVTLQFMKDLIHRIKYNKPPQSRYRAWHAPLHRKYAFTLLEMLLNHFKTQPSLVDITVPDGQNITVVGDIHGKWPDFINIFEKISGLPSETNRYLFNGDFVDRGYASTEIALILFGFKLLYPDTFFINRGNHEEASQNTGGGFEDECEEKYSIEMLRMFQEVFRWMPLAYLINKKVLVVHGGLFNKKGVTLDDIRRIKRGRDTPDREDSLLMNILWSDPTSKDGRHYNKQRMGGLAFGPDISESFCVRNHLDYVIRSHFPQPWGYKVQHGGRLVTVFSSSNYDRYYSRSDPLMEPESNFGAVAILRAPKLKPKFVIYHYTTYNDTKERIQKLLKTRAKAKKIPEYEIFDEY